MAQGYDAYRVVFDIAMPSLEVSSMIDFDAIWTIVTADKPGIDASWLHGPDHWRRVERNGLILSTQKDVKVDVVRLFAIFHDSRRINDGHDPEHGKRGAAYATSMRDVAYSLPNADFDLLTYACSWHTDEQHHDNPTIGACWDADRLDLGRVSVIPSAKYMNTDLGKQIANYGVIEPWIHLLPTPK